MGNSSIRVGSAVVVENDEGKILLAKSNKREVKDIWVLPGGGVKFGETAREAAKREIKEETGLEIEIENFITMYELIQKNDHRVIFYHKAKPVGGKLQPSDDVSELIWIKPKEINNMKNVSHVAIEILKKAKYF